MSTLVSLLVQDDRCSPLSTITTRPTPGQIRVLATMVSLVVVHSTAVALYVLGG